jgi:serine/threonine protein kinase
MEKYKKHKKLGQGSFGQVYLVIDTESPDQKQYVLKEIDLKAIGDEVSSLPSSYSCALLKGRFVELIFLGTTPLLLNNHYSLLPHTATASTIL